MKKDEAMQRRLSMLRAMEEIAAQVGKDSLLYRLMGPLAWGRCEHEAGPTDNAANAHVGVGYVEGARDVLLRLAREQHLPGETALARFWDRVRELE